MPSRAAPEDTPPQTEIRMPSEAAPFRTVHGQAKDLGGGFTVRRLLPQAGHRSVGPFVFFDHMGPLNGIGQREHDVRPHPHIGLCTLTYLLAGAMMHRDSTGAVQRIEPGAVNLMTAGQGVVHSERTPEDLIGQPVQTHGLQLWLALPRSHEEVPASFEHLAADRLPNIAHGGARIRVLAGEAFGERSPLALPMQTLYLDLRLAPGASVRLPRLAPEVALYAPDAPFVLDGRPVAARVMALPDANGCTVSAPPDAPTQVMVLGGEPPDGPRHLWWNFVSSRRERIEQAVADWEAGRFPTVPGETERIPAPPWRPQKAL